MTEPMIAGKTHSEILAMNRWMRYDWYKAISPEEKEAAMGIVEIARRAKISAAWTVRVVSEETKAKMSAAKMGENHPNFGKTLTEDTCAKISASKIGKPRSEETRTKLSAASIELWKDPEFRDKHSGENNHNFGKTFSKEHRAKMSVSGIGENNPSWRGGISFEPYCPAFNGQLKEKIRNRDNRTCVLCGKSEIQNGRRLSVHHIDGDKMQGCDGKKWYLCALCHSCNSRPDTIEKEFLIMTNQNRIGGGIAIERTERFGL